MIYLGNAISLNMLKLRNEKICLEIEPISSSDIPDEAVSIIGHDDTAAIVSNYLGRSYPVNRQTVLLNPEDVLYVAQYRGPRLPTGTEQLPPDAQLEFYRIVIRPA